MDQATNTTVEDRAWFAETVDVQIEQDNRSWLDTMLEMKQDELVNYAVHQYGIPEAAATAVGRNDLISMVVTANRAGGGQAVARQEYLYIPELLNVLEPAVSLFDESSKPLYLTRGSGSSRQVYDKVNDKWLNYEQTLAAHQKKTDETRAVASAAADTVSSHPSFNQTPPPAPAPAAPKLSPATIAVIEAGTLKRADLNQFALEVGIEDGLDQEKYKANKDLAEAIVAANQVTATEG